MSTTGQISKTGRNTGVNNGYVNSIIIGYNGYCLKSSKSRGRNIKLATTKARSFGSK